MNKKYKKINLMIPTYKRMDGLWKVIDSALQSAIDVNNLRFTFCVNKNDEDILWYLSFRYFPDRQAINIITEDTKQPNLSYYWNKMYNETRFLDDNTLVSMVADDMIFRTRNWDAAILHYANATDGRCIMHCNDNYVSRGQLAVNLFIPRPLVRATEQPYMCPYYHADMIDQVWDWTGKMTGTLKYFDDIIIEHEHCTLIDDRDKWDDTAKRLSPLRAIANKNKTIGTQYATRSAVNIIKNGFGKWNKL